VEHDHITNIIDVFSLNKVTLINLDTTTVITHKIMSLHAEFKNIKHHMKCKIIYPFL